MLSILKNLQTKRDDSCCILQIRIQSTFVVRITKSKGVADINSSTVVAARGRTPVDYGRLYTCDCLLYLLPDQETVKKLSLSAVVVKTNTMSNGSSVQKIYKAIHLLALKRFTCMSEK